MAPRTTLSTRDEATPAQSRAGQSLALLSLMSPRTGLVLLAVRALLAHVQVAMDQDPQVSFHGAAFQPFLAQSVRTSRVAWIHCQYCQQSEVINSIPQQSVLFTYQ